MARAGAASLHPSLLYHLVNTLGWPGLRPFQEAAVEPLMAGQDALLLAPTAGGKTEAAALPLLTRMETEGWNGLAILYICPLRALLNDLEARLALYTSWLGRRAGLWHGDTRAGERKRILIDPPNLLLTTPESLEAMLTSVGVNHRELFSTLRAVVVDELHAFMGDDRGWHLLAVLERLSRLAGRGLQRVGLSATVGNPEEILSRLQGSNRGNQPAAVISPPPASSDRPDVTLDYVGSIDNAATVIASLHGGEKRLVFCDSRRRVEELGVALRQRRVQTFLSHSSLSLDERRQTERAFAEARDCVIVATSTLELGIDIGDLDRVIQIDAPTTVASFRQRLGRTGRRPGTSSNCLLLATDHDALLQAAALLSLWSSGWVEPVELPSTPLHILAQQILALVLQEGQIGLRTWPAWLEGAGLLDSQAEPEAVINHLISHGFVFEDQGMLTMGGSAEQAFGRRHFMELTSVFTSDPEFAVLHGRYEVGRIHPLTLTQPCDGPRRILLGGQTWEVTHTDWARRRCHVKPATGRGRVRWRGDDQVLHARLCRAMREVALGARPEVEMTRRIQEELPKVQAELAHQVDGDRLVVHRDPSGRSHWWTWAGGQANATLAAALPEFVEPSGRTHNLAIRLRGDLDFEAFARAVGQASLGTLPAPVITDGALRGLKFSEALPTDQARLVLARRLGDPEIALEALKYPVLSRVEA